MSALTEEHLTINRISNTKPTTYVLKDDDAGEELGGSFYHEEIQ